MALAYLTEPLVETEVEIGGRVPGTAAAAQCDADNYRRNHRHPRDSRHPIRQKILLFSLGTLLCGR